MKIFNWFKPNDDEREIQGVSLDPSIIPISQEDYNEFLKWKEGKAPMSEAQREIFIANVNQQKAIGSLNWATSDRESATAFQMKINCLLNGMAEIRFALNFPSVDSSKEMGQERVALKEIFETEAERDRLKQQYGKVMDIYVRVVSQLDVKK